MIVSCPSCGTRYRVEDRAAGPSRCGRCSQCEALVPFVAAPRPYVLLPQPAGPGAGIESRQGWRPASAAAATSPPFEDPAATCEPPGLATLPPLPGIEGPRVAGAEAPDPGWRLVLVPLLVAAVGALAGYHWGADDTLVALGALCGLLVGWVGTRWMASQP